MAPFYVWSSTASRLQSYYNDAVYISPPVPRSSCYSFDQPQKVDKTRSVFLGETDAQYEK